MSSYLDRKKESIRRVNKLMDDMASGQAQKEQIDALNFKYEKLSKKYDQLSQVFEFHKGIIQNISSSMITIDMEGIITFANKSALHLLGFSADNILGKKIDLFFAEQDEGQQIVNALIEQEKIYESHETRLLASGEEVIPIGFSTTFLSDEKTGERTGIVFIFRDIRDLINFRKQMERMDRLATLGELSAGIAHEIRNPLAGIKASAQVLEESFSPGDHRTQLISRIVKEIDRTNKLLQSFFNFAKPNKPKPGFHSLKNITEGIFLLLATRLKRRKIKFHSEFEEKLPLIYIDESQLEQVLLNLALNAFDAMPDGGTLSINAHFDTQYRFSGVEGSAHGAIIVTVKDTGVGISNEKFEKIFNPFYTSKSDGVGLGLSISSRLLEENQSKIEVDSTLGKGTSFTIYLPYVHDNRQEY